MKPALRILTIVLSFAAVATGQQRLCDVTAHGARPDDSAVDTKAIQSAIDDCHAAGGGMVRIPAGVYLAGTVHFRSNITLHLETGAVLRSSPNFEDYEVIRDQVWRVRPWLFGRDVENVAITGQGLIDGAKVFNRKLFADRIKVKHPDQMPGWLGGETNRGPHTVVFYDSKHIQLHDFRITDSANYAVRIRNSEDVDIRGLTITAGWDGINIHHSRQVTISNCRIQTGDDAIAGSGNENMVINNCVLNSSCNGVRLMYGNKRVVLSDLVIYGPGAYEHRTSKRHNTESGITIRPFRPPDEETPAGDDLTENVLISNIVIDGVHRPFLIGIHKGNSGMRGLVIRNVTVTRGGKESSLIHGEPGAAIEDVTLSGIRIHASGGMKRQGGITPAYGFEFRHIDDVTLRDVVLRLDEADERPALLASHVGRLAVDGYRADRSPGAAAPVEFEHVGELAVNSSPSLPVQTASILKVEAAPARGGKGLMAGIPFSLRVSAKGSGDSGMHRFPLGLGDKEDTGWLWIDGAGKTEAELHGFVIDGAGNKEITAGNARTAVVVEPRPEGPAVRLESVDVTPVPVDKVTVTAIARNVGRTAGSGVLAARIGAAEERAEFNVKPDEQKTVRLTIDAPAAGKHTVVVDGFPPQEITVPGPVGGGLRTAGDADCCFQFPGEERYYIRSPRKRYEIADEYQAVFRADALASSGSVTVKVAAPDRRGGWASRSGIVVRDDAAAPFSDGYLVLAASGGNGWSMQWDTDGDGILDTHTEFDGYTIWPHWLRLDRKSDQFTGYYSTDGSEWHKVGEATVSGASGALDAGFFVTGATAEFSEFQVNGRQENTP